MAEIEGDPRSWRPRTAAVEPPARHRPDGHLRHRNRSAVPVRPGSWLDDGAEAVTMARQVNEFGAELVQDRPDRFRYFATVPLHDPLAAVAAATYALDELASDGVVLLANTDGVYLGHPGHDPLLAELDRRCAVVFVHPSELLAPPVPGLPPLAADFLLDTTRAVAHLVLHGVPRHYPDLKILLSHTGGFLPYAAHRVTAALVAETGRDFEEILEDLRSFWFDTALSGSPSALPSLLAFACPDRVLFDTDWPFAPEVAVAHFTGEYDRYPGLDSAGPRHRPGQRPRAVRPPGLSRPLPPGPEPRHPTEYPCTTSTSLSSSSAGAVRD
ncbi:amidohydrolase family protein [Streptomyces sp. NPDC054783]